VTGKPKTPRSRDAKARGVTCSVYRDWLFFFTRSTVAKSLNRIRPARGAPPGSSTIPQDPKSAAGSRAQTERLPHQN